MKAILFLLFLITCWNLNAQSNRQALEVTHGDTLNKVVNNDIRYAFEEFTNGMVMFKNGTTAAAKLNYDYLMEEMQFIDEKTGDIMALASPSDVSIVAINGRKFIYKSGSAFIEQLSDGNTYLGVYRKAKATSAGKTGAYGTVSNTSSIESLSSTGDARYSFAVKEHIQVKTDDVYYLYDNGKASIIKNVKSYTKAYPSSKASSIEKYAADNDINFKKAADLIKLTEYCNQL